MNIQNTKADFHCLVAAFSSNTPRLRALDVYSALEAKYSISSDRLGLLGNLQFLDCRFSDWHAFLTVFPQLPHLQHLTTALTEENEIVYLDPPLPSESPLPCYRKLKILIICAKNADAVLTRAKFPLLTHVAIKMPPGQYCVVTPSMISIFASSENANSVVNFVSANMPAERRHVTLSECMDRLLHASQTLVDNLQDVPLHTCPVDE